MEKNENGFSLRRNNSGSSLTGGCGCGNQNNIDGCPLRNQGNGASNGGTVGKTTDSLLDNGNSMQLAMVYSPYQNWQLIYTPEMALKHGTLFEELYKPLDLEGCKNG